VSKDCHKHECNAKNNAPPQRVDAGILNTVLPLADAVVYQAGTIVSRTLVETRGCTVTAFAFDKDQALSEHSAPFHALVQVLDGTGEFTIGGTARTLNAGQAIVMPADVPHAVRAVARFKMLLTMARA
jgi:quercetin dioxygenase-like cupin family protein